MIVLLYKPGDPVTKGLFYSFEGQAWVQAGQGAPHVYINVIAMTAKKAKIGESYQAKEVIKVK